MSKKLDYCPDRSFLKIYRAHKSCNMPSCDMEPKLKQELMTLHIY